MRLLLLTFFFCFYSCNQNDDVKTYRLAKPSNQGSTMKASKPTPTNIEFSWDVPDSWEKGKISSMRLGSYNVPYSNGLADLSITNFSGDGGGLLSNVNRWRKQLNLPPHTIEEINKNVIIAKSGLGNYEIHKIINDNNEDSAFLCSILSIENTTIFVKLVTTKNGINELEKVFTDFCSSFKYNN